MQSLKTKKMKKMNKRLIITLDSDLIETLELLKIQKNTTSKSKIIEMLIINYIEKINIYDENLKIKILQKYKRINIIKEKIEQEKLKELQELAKIDWLNKS